MKWPTESLGSLCDVITGGTPKRTVDEYWNGEIPWVKISDMLQGEIKYTDESITNKGLRESPARLLEPGTLLMSIFATVGRTAVLAIPAATNQAIVGLRIKTYHLDQRYLRHYLDSQAESLKSKSRGVAQDNINTTILKSLRIPLPPLEEQRRIAAILDKAAEISDANKRRQNLLKAFPLSVYRQMLGDPRQNPFQWPVFSLGEICLNEDARRVPVKSSDRKAMQGRFPYYGASGIIDHVDSYLFDGPRLLVGEDGANLLARSSPIAFIADGKYWVNNHAHVLGENGKAKLRFLEYYFALVDLKPFVTGSAQPKLTRSALDSLPVPLPPLDLQERFESVLTAMNITLAQVKTSNEQALSLINALRHMSFQGESA
jgi:type I restriction enzyme S subunit